VPFLPLLISRVVGSASSDIPSGYTPLHQAAHHGASEEIVKTLLGMGAWSMLRYAFCIMSIGNHLLGLARTLRSGSSRIRSTPLDVARQHGWAHLFDILSPVVRRTVHYGVLQDLQDRLHNLIREGFKNDPQAQLECFVLPELEILTEFEHARLWFPLQPELIDTREGLAVHLTLDREELVVTLRWGRVERRLYRITRWETKEINQAVILSS
jgi:Ankyrin repeat